MVAMATYSSHRLIMGKVEIGNFYFLIGYNRILFLQQCIMGKEEIDQFFFLIVDICLFVFTEMFIQQSSTFHTTFV